MCDFHSVIVTGDGRILHHESNSHSRIADTQGLPRGLGAKWWECEWNGRGEVPMPHELVQTRGKTVDPTQAAYRAAESHYRKLAHIMAGELDPHFIAPFDSPEYSDVRDAYAKVMAVKRFDDLFEPLADELAEQPDATLIQYVHLLADRWSLDMEEVAADEIAAAIEADETRYDQGFSEGYEAASEEMYSFEYMQEEIESAVEKAREEWEEGQLESAREEAYLAGYRAAQRGRASEYAFIDGMPSFLF